MGSNTTSRSGPGRRAVDRRQRRRGHGGKHGDLAAAEQEEEAEPAVSELGAGGGSDLSCVWVARLSLIIVSPAVVWFV